MTTNNTSQDAFMGPADKSAFPNKKLGNSTETNKQDVVSVTYEEIGLFPRSFSRVTDRFLQQIFSDVDNLIIHEYRFYRYLFFTTFKSLLILFCVPFLVNLLAKNYIVRPLTEYMWNSRQTEIFLNTYQQKRAFLELKDFEEKLYFESLVSPPPVPVSYYRATPYSLEYGPRKDSQLVINGFIGSADKKTNSIYGNVVENSYKGVWQSHTPYIIKSKIKRSRINTNIRKATDNIFSKKNMLSETKVIHYPSPFTAHTKYSAAIFSMGNSFSNDTKSSDSTLSPMLGIIDNSKKINSIVLKTLGTGNSPYPNSIYLKKKKLNFNNLIIKSEILDFLDN